MSAHDNGGPAFPTGDSQDSKLGANYGMSLRDYFAAKAMQAVITSQPEIEDLRIIAGAAYGMADAMLKARAAATGGQQ